MNIESLISLLSEKMSKVYADVKSKLSSDSNINDPSQTVKMQFAVQQYSNLVSLESSLVKVFKDLFSGIISKI